MQTGVKLASHSCCCLSVYGEEEHVMLRLVSITSREEYYSVYMFIVRLSAYRSLIEILWVHSCSSMRVFMFISYPRVKSTNQQRAYLKSR